MPEITHRKKRLSSFKLIVLGFAGVILLGALILMLPFSSTAGVVTPFHEALFTSTSAVCVTGLVVQDTGSYWSAFGQTVILLMIQIGGLGVVTVAAFFAMLSGRKISLMQRSTMQDAISAPKVGGIVRLTRFIVRGTFLIELIGMIVMLPTFCGNFGIVLFATDGECTQNQNGKRGRFHTACRGAGRSADKHQQNHNCLRGTGHSRKIGGIETGGSRCDRLKKRRKNPFGERQPRKIAEEKEYCGSDNEDCRCYQYDLTLHPVFFEMPLVCVNIVPGQKSNTAHNN